MKKIFYLATVTTFILIVAVASALGVCRANAQATEARSSEGMRSNLSQFFKSECLTASGFPVVLQGASLSAQALEDIQPFLDPSGDSLLAPDVAALTIGYDPDVSQYAFMASFYKPFYGLTTRDSVFIHLDTDKNASTGIRWFEGIGTDYTIGILGLSSGWSAGLARTPSSDSSTWSMVGTLQGLQDTVADCILVAVPGYYFGSPLSFNLFMYSNYEGLYDDYFDFLPDLGYVTYLRVSSTTTTTLPPTTTTTLPPTTTTTLPPATTTTTTVPQQPVFEDLDTSHPYYTAIMELARREIVIGYGDTFGPDDPVSRQQFAKMIVKTLELPVTGSEVCPFVDVGQGIGSDPYYPDKYVAVCAANGITRGSKDPTRFAPYDPITRQQLVSMVARAAGLGNPLESYEPPFLPSQFYPEEHYLNARKAAYAGLFEGLVGLGPGYDFFARATRGEVCLFLYNLLLSR